MSTTTKRARKSATAAVSAPVVLVTTMADFTALSVEDRQIRFAEKAQVHRVSFSEMGKLHYLISEDLTADNAAHPRRKARTIYGELRSRGVSDKSISNASYASRVWAELVATDHLTEAQFDELTFQDCFKITRAMSPRSELQLDAAAVAELITQQPADFDLELESLYENGMTVAECAAQDAATAAAQAASLAKAQAAASTPTSTGNTTGGPRSVAASPSASAGPTATAATGESATGTTTETNTGSEGTEAESGSGTDTGQPSNITQMPAAEATDDPDKNLACMLDVLGEIEAESEGFTAEGQRALLEAIDDLRGKLAARLEPAPVESAEVAA